MSESFIISRVLGSLLNEVSLTHATFTADINNGNYEGIITDLPTEAKNFLCYRDIDSSTNGILLEFYSPMLLMSFCIDRNRGAPSGDVYVGKARTIYGKLSNGSFTYPVRNTEDGNYEQGSEYDLYVW